MTTTLLPVSQDLDNTATRQNTLGWFLTHPEERIQATDVARMGNIPVQLAKRHCEKLAAEGKLDRERDKDLKIFFKLSATEKRRLKLNRPRTEETKAQLPVKTEGEALTEAQTEAATVKVPHPLTKNAKRKGANRPTGVHAGKIGEIRNHVIFFFESQPDSKFKMKDVAEFVEIQEASVAYHVRNLIEANIIKIVDKSGRGYTYQWKQPKQSKTPPKEAQEPLETTISDVVTSVAAPVIAPPVPVSAVTPIAAPIMNPMLKATLLSIVSRLKTNQQLNEFDIQVLEEHIKGLV